MTTAGESTAQLHRELGLSDEEAARIEALLGRTPNHTELAMFSVMWSEHCSYKSSRRHLRSLPSDGPHVVVGPGEGAGVIEVAPGVSVAWKIESHNHPSFVEPASGAATGVGGIVRDVLSMGARPVALLDSLRFGPLHEPRSRYLVDGVVHGISSYGNAIGVPTVGGEMVFDGCYAENPLVNVACLGVVEDRIMRGNAGGVGNAVVLIGALTGRDGIGGASVLASAELDEGSSTKRPSVQVGDPLAEKLLIEACLELVRRDLIAGLQDLGAGGISCPTSEMSAKAGTGMRIDIAGVARREEGMAPFEVMISESQERMMAVVDPADVAAVTDVCERWEIPARVIGEVTDTGRIEVRDGESGVADIPAPALADEAPVLERPAERPPWLSDIQAAPPGDEAPGDLTAALLAVLASPTVASKRWVFEQYDHMIGLGTLRGPGCDAAVIRLPGEDVAVALSVDGPGRFAFLDPYEGARLAVAEAARNVAVTGARPLAVTNCLNFGSPEKPGVMWQFEEAVRGLGDACRDLGLPVVGGNVSFYNETRSGSSRAGQERGGLGPRAEQARGGLGPRAEQARGGLGRRAEQGGAIYPTPVVGVLGSLRPATLSVGPGFADDGDAIVLLGDTRLGDFGGSEYAKVVNGTVAGRPPRLDLEAERRLHDLLRSAVRRGLLSSAHGLADGGLAVALAEAALAGGRGFRAHLPTGVEAHRALFSESPSRAIVTTARANDLLALASDSRVSAALAGEVGGQECDCGAVTVTLAEVAKVHENALPSAVAASVGSSHVG
ncbi:phosphoribosylformylglycinamidine synthase subunit PurL [soil metagenome]